MIKGQGEMELRKISDEELKIILELHKLWLENNMTGKRANLSYVDLKGADLIYANLEGADLEGSDLEGANLKSADLEGADLVILNEQ